MAQENISAQLNDLLASRDFQPELLDKDGRPTDAENADIFTFDFVSRAGKNYGTMVIILDSDNEMQVFYGDNLGRSMEGDDKTEFFDFVQHLHKFANMRRWTYSPKNINQVKYTMQGLAAIKEGLFEGYYGTRKVSYSGEPTEARLVIQHNRTLGEADARFRYVESLFIETADSERYRLQFKNLAGGRAMLEHVRQGGKPYDVRGCHITEMVSEIATLSRFNRASAGRVLEGVTAELVTEAQQYYRGLRENLKRMAGTRGYQAYFESWHPAETTLQEELVDSIKTLFVEQTLDTRIEAALPVLARLQQESKKMKEAEIFESWVEQLSEGTWALPDTPEKYKRLQDLMSRELIVGPDATNATEQLGDLVGDDQLFDYLEDLADRDPRANVWDDTDVQARLSDLGIQLPGLPPTDNEAEAAADQQVPVQESRRRKIDESLLMEDPIYRNFKQVGRYIAERRMSEKEILQVFADAEAGMTNTATGANRTMLGRGKDKATDLATSIRDSVGKVLSSIQNSVPVSAVDTAYDQATDALAGLAGGQKGKVMQAIKKYRMLVKKYPKSAGFAKAALVAITGLATGGAGLPAIAGLTYALDSAIKGEKLSSVLGKGAGAAALAWAGQAISGAMSGGDSAAAAATGTRPGVMDYSYDNFITANPTTTLTQAEFAAQQAAGTLGSSGTNLSATGADTLSNFVTPDKFPVADLTTYTVQAGDTLSQIARDNGVSIRELIGLNPQLADATGATGGQSMNPDVLFVGQEITLPPASGSPTYDGGVGTGAGTQADIASGQIPDSEISQRLARAGQATPSGPTNLAPNFDPNNVPPGMKIRYAPPPLKESVKLIILPFEQLIDQKRTEMAWTLNESIGRQSNSFVLTAAGTHAVFENVDRYRQAMLELAGVPGSTRPALYRPDMPGAAVAPAAKKPGLLSRGLSKVGSALSTFGRQFTTNVTKEKLKMNWHQAGKPSDSDQLAAWLVKQGVPQEVVDSVYKKMNLPVTAAPVRSAAEWQRRYQSAPADGAAGAGAFGAMAKNLQQPEKSSTGGTTAQTATGIKHTANTQNPNAKPAAAAATTTAAAKPGTQPATFNAGNVMNLPGMEKYAKPATPAKTPNFAGPGGYGKVTTSFKSPTAAEKTKLAQRIAQAKAKDLAESLLAEFAAGLDGPSEDTVSEGSLAKKTQPYHDPNWAKNLPKEKLDSIAGKKHKKSQPDVKEGSTCNHTMEGEMCPEHGLAECGTYESQVQESDAQLARLKSLAHGR